VDQSEPARGPVEELSVARGIAALRLVRQRMKREQGARSGRATTCAAVDCRGAHYAVPMEKRDAMAGETKPDRVAVAKNRLTRK
jgi:hypothetical protein